MSRRSFPAAFAVLLVLSQLALIPAPALAAEKPGTDTPISTTGRHIVEFEAQADLAPAEAIDDRPERGQFVVDRLRDTARVAQRDALALAKRVGMKATPYWLRNVIVVEGTDAQLAQLERLPGVSSVRPEKIYPLVEPLPSEAAIAVAVGDPEWGVAKIGADQVWAEGILGSGIVVANVDTGVEYTHAALVEQYRGNLGGGVFDHNYNWWDPTGVCGPTPCDNAGHGTHTMGTMVGGDGPGPFTPDIGVAPGAEWIATKGCEDFGCSETSLLSAGQFILAPTDLAGLNADPAKAPDIVNNSWGGGPGDPFYLEIVQAWRAAGIIPVFSSGNPGPFCGEGGSPGDFVESFSAGATDINDVIADFSGRGPSAYGKVNPDVTAPGVDVNSSVPGGGYAAFSGTSMAAPHTAGTLALMLSAANELVGDFDGATSAMRATAVDIIDLSCGGDADGDPNNVYGDGRIDAQAAVALVATGGTLVGTVTDADTGDPLAGAKITADNGARTFTASGAVDGTYKLFLPAGSYDVTAAGFGYETGAGTSVEIVTDVTTTQDFALTALPRVTLSGTVRTAEAGLAVPGALVEPLGVPVEPVTADPNGAYSIVLPIGSYTIQASNGGCINSASDSLSLDQDTVHDFGLVSKIDQFGHGCDVSPQAWVNATGRFKLRGDDKAIRTKLPFAFPFFGSTYERVWVTTNGYLTFDRPDFPSYVPDEIPSRSTPNNAIYPLWTDLVIDDASQVRWSMIRPPNREPRAYVLEFDQLRVFGGTATVDVEVLLWDDGRIDTLYRNNSGAPGDGSTATIGLENQDGTDAFQFSSGFASLREDVGYRYQVVPTGFADGVVTDLNDGLPVVGATVTAQPSGATGVTGGDGSYSIRLVPGDHSLDVSAPLYVGASSDITIVADASTTTDFSLAAAVAGLSTETLATTTQPEVAAEVSFDISNTGSASLEWFVKERDLGATPPDLPDAPTAIAGATRRPEWRPAPWLDGLAPTASVDFTGPYEAIIDDPMGDAIGSVDVIGVRGGADDQELGLAIDLSPGSPVDQTVGYVFLDTDQNSATGASPVDFAGLDTQDVGIEYFIDLFAASEGVAFVVDARTFDVVAVVPVETTGQTLTVVLPLESIGDDGAVNIAMVIGDFAQPTDWVPDEGHGAIIPFRDAAWMSADPTSGALEPGETTTVTVTLGGAGFVPGEYEANLAVVANDPRNPVQLLDVSFTIELPDTYGSLTGTITNARAGFPVPADVTVEAEVNGQPYTVTGQADDVSGQYLLFVPEGTWPATYDFGGYQTHETDVTITALHKTTYDVELSALWAFASVTGGPLDFTLAADATASSTLTLANQGGLADLEFEVLELGGAAQIALPAAAAVAVSPSSTAPAGWLAQSVTRQINGGSVAVFMDALPWGTDALTQVLDNQGIAYDLLTSTDMSVTDLTPYEAVILANDQPQAFYDTYASNEGRFEDYVVEGGFLWFGAAAWGWNEGDFDGGELPGGVTAQLAYEEVNHVAQPDHPAMSGVPDPFTGGYASHTGFSNVPPGSIVASGDASGLPTMVDYELGSGRVLAIGQTVDFAWAFGQDAAIILPNSIAYAVAFEPYTDVTWLTEAPVSGVIAPDGSIDLDVTVDTTGLAAGTYTASVVIKTNDPLNPTLKVPVTLNVTE